MTPTGGDSSDDPFKSGSHVEASFDDEGFRGSWYSATVVRQLSKRTYKKPHLLLQFHTLTAAAGKQPLREAVDLILIRPVPPRELQRSFHVGEDVDAFHNDGWWEGIVISVVDDGKYSVFFRSSHEQLVFPESQLRIHREWVHEKWVPPLEDGVPLPERT